MTRRDQTSADDHAVQLTFACVSRFPDKPRDMPMSEVVNCSSEEEAVIRSLEFARVFFRLERRAVQMHCGWKSHSRLSDICNPNKSDSIPQKKLHLFCQATGCNLLKQYRELHAAKNMTTQSSVLLMREEAVQRMVMYHDRRMTA